MHGNDEEKERVRLQREREKLSPIDRLHGSPPRTTKSGFLDGRSNRRTGRMVQLPLRLHPRVRAIVDAIMVRDRHPSMVALFEEMIEAYQKVHGAVDTSLLPSDQELIHRIEQARDKDDAK